MLYQFLLDKAVHATRKFCSVACRCLGKTVQNLVTDLHIIYLDVASLTNLTKNLMSCLFDFVKEYIL